MKLFVVLVVLVCFCFGGRRGRVSFGGGVVVAVVCFCFGGRWRFGVGCETVRRPRRPRLFLFWGTEGASQLWWWCRRRRPRRPRLFLFWGTEGASQLWWWCRRRRRLFLFRGDGGASQLWCWRRRRLFLFRGTVAIWSWVCSSSPSVFVLGGRGSESALVSPSPSVFVSGDGGEELGVFVAVVCFCFGRAGEQLWCRRRRRRLFCFGGTGERVSFGGGVVVAVVCFCFGGRWRFGVGCVRRRRRRLFLFWGTVARSWVCSSPSSVFVSGDGGDLELGVFVVAVCFCFGRAGESALVSPSSSVFVSGGRGRVSFRGAFKRVMPSARSRGGRAGACRV